MSRPIATNSVNGITIDYASSPFDNQTFTVSGAPVAGDNRTFDLAVLADKARFNHLLRVYYATYTPGNCRVESIYDIEKVEGSLTARP